MRLQSASFSASPSQVHAASTAVNNTYQAVTMEATSIEQGSLREMEELLFALQCPEGKEEVGSGFPPAGLPDTLSPSSNPAILGW